MSFQLSNESARAMHVEAVDAEAALATNARRAGLPRWVDATLAFVGLIVSSPIMALAGLAIAVSSSGPIVFKQKRVGQHGRLFNLYKLRTMRPSIGGPEVTSKNDTRITPLGRFLRRTKLDEMPTLWNVLRGDMALVGPRPEVPRYVQLDDPSWKAVLAVRPGLTDPVTFSLRNEEELLAGITTDTERFYLEELQPSKLKGYISYLETRTWRSDLKIFGKTLAAIATGNKA